jgi:hypothetical protein
MPTTKNPLGSSSKARNSESVLDAETQANLLKDEYVMLQNLYEDFDSKGLTIKSWSITVALATIGTAVLAKRNDLLLVAFVSALVFWYLEAYWRGLAYFFAVRIQNIEAAFRTEKWKEEVPLQLYSTWSETYKIKRDQTLRHMLKQSSILPHFVIAIVSLVLYFWH